jgi:hypothetical protein
MTAAEQQVYWVVNMTTDKRMQFQICLFDAGIEANSGSMADTDRVVN